MKKFELYPILFVGALLGLFLAACSGPRLVPPAEATVNGVTGIDREKGAAEFSVSGFSSDGELVTSGIVANVSGTVDQAGFSVAGDVCGDIDYKGPITGALTLDASGSMINSDPNENRAVAAKAFVNRMQPDDRAAVTAFEGYKGHQLYADFTSDKTVLYAGIDKATYAGGGTPLWDSSYGIVTFLSELEGDNKMALIFTDGKDTGSRTDPEELIAHAQQKSVRLFMIGLGTPGTIEIDAMTNVSIRTGGTYSDNEGPEKLDRLFTNVLSASKAGGCIGLAFSPVPAAGQAMTGEVSFTIDGGGFTGAYEVRF